ncbi:MAG TPA: pirin family protein [Candidatus Thermoplasmatota archaeon]
MLPATPTLEGAGVHLKRAFGDRQLPRLDPFLLLDDFHSDNPIDYIAGFPWHPHRGMETVTYVLDGRVEHGDSLGNKGVVGPGDVQWMTAGSGIVHQEMPKGRDGRMAGLQLWVNLPKQHKMMDPRYQEIQQAHVPVVSVGDGVDARIIAGTLNGVQGPVRDLMVEPEYFDVTMKPNSRFIHRVPRDHTVFSYMVDGRASFDPGTGDEIDGEHLVIYKPGELVEIETRQKHARFLLVAGKPLREPISWWGPMVMNTRQEIEVAIEEFQNGTFVKKRGTVKGA